MSLSTIKVNLETYFQTNWTTTSIQWHGVAFNSSALTQWIGLKFVPIQNEMYAFDGSSCGRIEYNAQMQVFCYAKNPTKAIQLADSVMSFLNGTTHSPDIVVGIGQVDSGAVDLGNGLFEVMVYFEINLYA